MTTAQPATTQAPHLTQTVTVHFHRCGNSITALDVNFTATSDTNLADQIGTWVARQINGATVAVDFDIAEGTITGPTGTDQGWFAIMGPTENEGEWR